MDLRQRSVATPTGGETGEGIAGGSVATMATIAATIRINPNHLKTNSIPSAILRALISSSSVTDAIVNDAHADGCSSRTKKDFADRFWDHCKVGTGEV